MHTFTASEMSRIRLAIAYQSTAMRKQNSPTTQSVERELSEISNKLREVDIELVQRGRVIVEVKT